MTTLSIATSDNDLQACFAAFKKLRPQLVTGDFIPQIRRQELQGYKVLALRKNGVVKSVAGFRLDTGYARHETHRLYLRKKCY